MVDSAFEATVLAFIEVNGSYLSDKPETAGSIEISAKESHGSHSSCGFSPTQVGGVISQVSLSAETNPPGDRPGRKRRTGRCATPGRR